MRTFILSCALALGSLSTFAQGYQFTDVVKVPATPVKNHVLPVPTSEIKNNALIEQYDEWK